MQACSSRGSSSSSRDSQGSGVLAPGRMRCCQALPLCSTTAVSRAPAVGHYQESRLPISKHTCLPSYGYECGISKARHPRRIHAYIHSILTIGRKIMSYEHGLDIQSTKSMESFVPPPVQTYHPLSHHQCKHTTLCPTTSANIPPFVLPPVQSSHPLSHHQCKHPTLCPTTSAIIPPLSYTEDFVMQWKTSVQGVPGENSTAVFWTSDSQWLGVSKVAAHPSCLPGNLSYVFLPALQV